MNRKKIHLGLGAGNAYGFVHAGVLKALHEKELVPDKITGVSFGSLIAAFYARFDCDAEKLYSFIYSLEFRDILKLADPSIYDGVLFRGRKLERFLRHHLGDMTIADSPVPLTIYAAHPEDRSIYFFPRNTMLYKAVMASTAVPPMLRVYHGLYDGGFNTLVPGPLLDKNYFRIVADPYNLPRYDSIPFWYKGWLDYSILRQFIRARKEGKSSDLRLLFDLGDALIVDYTKHRWFMKQGYEQSIKQINLEFLKAKTKKQELGVRN